MSPVTETQLPAGFERFDAALYTTGDTPRFTGSVDPTSIARPINRLPKGGPALANEVTLQVDLQLVRADG